MGIEIHRSRRIDRAVREGFCVTRPLRTLVDLAACVTEEQLDRAANAAHRFGLVDPARLKLYLDEPSNLNKVGSRILREIAASMSEQPNDSELETLFYSALRRSGLPLPVAQHPVTTQDGPKFIDYAYPDPAIAVELDSWTHHGSRTAFEADRPRRNELELLGWHVLQFTWRQLRNDPVGIAWTIARALGLRPVRWRSM